jgi:hypothetical protein
VNHTTFGNSIRKSAAELAELGLPYIHLSQVGYYDAIRMAQEQCGENWRIIGEWGNTEADLPVGSVRIGQVRVHPSDTDFAIIAIPAEQQ